MSKGIFTFLITRMMNVYVLSLGLLSTLWGLALMFGTFGNNNLSEFMSTIAPEFVWGSVAILAGLLMAYGSLRECLRSTRLGLMIAFLVWVFVFLTYMISLPYSTAVVTSAFIAWCHVMGYLVVSSRPEVLEHSL